MFTIAAALVVVLFVSGLIEAFVTPSPMPTVARIVMGVVTCSATSATAGTSIDGPPRPEKPATSPPSTSGTTGRWPAEPPPSQPFSGCWLAWSHCGI